MKTRCIFSVEITVTVDETWDDKAPVSQVTEDASRMASGRIHAAMPTYANAAKIRLKRVELFPKSAGDPA